MFKGYRSFLNSLYQKILRLDDTNHNVSLGFALGVAVGIIPGTGPIASLILALLLHINPACALLGSLSVNTWFSILTLVPAAKIGAILFKLNWQDIYSQWLILFSTIRWKALLKVSLYKIVLPIFLGYAIIALVAGISTYIIVRIILIKRCR